MPELPKGMKRARTSFLRITLEKRVAGKVSRTGNYFWHGDLLDEGGHNEVSYAIVKIAGQKKSLMEKRFFRPNAHPEQDFMSLSMLRDAGVKTVPEFMLAHTKNEEGKLERSLVMTDLTERGKYQVYSTNIIGRNREIRKIIDNLKNLKEIQEQMSKDQLMAQANLGISLNSDMWLIRVDPKTNTGESFIVDVDTFSVREKDFYDDPFVRDLKQAGIKSGEFKEVYARIQAIKGRFQNPLKSTSAQIELQCIEHRSEIARILSEVISSKEDYFQTILEFFRTHFSFMKNTHGRNEYNTKRPLTQDQRRIINKLMDKKELKKYLHEVVEPKYRRLSLDRMKKWNAVFNLALMDEKYGGYQKDLRNALITALWPKLEFKFVDYGKKVNQPKLYAIGKTLSESLIYYSKKLGHPIFGFDPEKVKQCDSLLEQIKSVDPEEAKRLLIGKEDLFLHKLISVLFFQLRTDTSEFAKFRLMRDEKPYNEKIDWRRNTPSEKDYKFDSDKRGYF